MPQASFNPVLLSTEAVDEKALAVDTTVPDPKLLDTRALDSTFQPLPTLIASPFGCPSSLPDQSNPRASEYAAEAVKALRVMLAVHGPNGDGPPLGPRKIGRLLGEALLMPENGDPHAVAEVATALREEIAGLARGEPDGYLLYEVVPAYAEVADERFGPCFTGQRPNNFEHLFDGFAQGIADSGVFTLDTASGLFTKYSQSMMTWNVLATTVIQTGMGYGILERFAMDLKGIVELIGLVLQPEELERLIETIMTTLYDPKAEQEAFEMGHMLALAFLKPIIDLTKTASGFWFLWELGKLLGPIFLDIIMMIFGVGEITFIKHLVTGPAGISTVTRVFTKHVRRAAPKLDVPEPVDVFRTSVKQIADADDTPAPTSLVERLRDPELHDLVDEIAAAIDDDIADLDESLKIMEALTDKQLRGLAWYQRIYRGGGRAQRSNSPFKSGKGTPGATNTLTNPEVSYRYRRDRKTGKSVRTVTNAGGAHFNWHNLLTDFPLEFNENFFEVLADLGPKTIDDSIRFPLGAIMRGGKEAQGAWGSLLAARRALELDPNLAFRYEVPDHVVAPTLRNVEYDFVAYRVRSEGEQQAIAALAETLDPKSWENNPLVEVVVRAEVKDYHKTVISEGGRIRDQMKRYLVDAIENGDLDFEKLAYYVPASNETKLRKVIESELLKAFKLDDVYIAVKADPSLDYGKLKKALEDQIDTGRMVRTYGYDPSSVTGPTTPTPTP